MQVKQSTSIFSDVAQILSGSNKEALLLVSGGSQQGILPELFGAILKSNYSPSKLTVSVLDERYVQDLQSADSNFAQAIQMPEAQALQNSGTKFVSLLDGKTDLVHVGDKLAGLINEYCDSDGKLAIGLLGLGLDGHIAGIIKHSPDRTAIFYAESAEGYSSSTVQGVDEYPGRVSITFAGIVKLDYAFVYAVGEPKREIIQRIVDASLKNSCPTQDEIAVTPGLFLATLDNLTLYTDLTLANI